MVIIKQCLLFVGLLSVVSATYNGPFLFWGTKDLKNLDVSALANIDDKLLRNLYSEAASVVMFLRNGSSKLSEENYPMFKEMIEKNDWAYLPQHWLSSDPVDYNVNAEVIHLVGLPEQQDIELSALFKDAINNYGEGKVLGILASHWDEHTMHKRDVREETTTTTSPTSNPTEEPMENDYIYYAAGKILLYTNAPPSLHLTDNTTYDDISLKSHGIVTGDERDQLSRLIVSFKTDEGNKLILRFRFPLQNGYWSLTSVEVEESTRVTILTVVGEPPLAPIGFSHKCSNKLIFKNGTMTLTMENVQVQPLLGGAARFSDAYDCVGFMSAPIWSGILIAFIGILGITIAINAILEIKPPNRFESNRSKQLTFSVQE